MRTFVITEPFNSGNTKINMRILSKIQIKRNTEFSKEKITQQLLNLVKGRLTVLKKEIQEINTELISFQKHHSMTNEEVLDKFKNGTLGDDSQFFV